MRDTLYKYLPWALGGLIGFFMFRPPAFFSDLGPLAWAIQGALLALALLSFVFLMLLGNLPENLQMNVLPETAVPRDVQGISAEIEALGFRRVGAPWEVKVAPAATLLGFVHESEPVYATAFCTGTVPAKVSFDFVSIFDGPQGGLTTNNIAEGAVLPAGNSSMRQVFPGQAAEALFRRHLEGIQWLQKQGVRCRKVSTDRFESDFKAAMQHQRRMVLDAPLRGTFVTLWRAATKQVPFVGPLAQQSIASQQLVGLRGARPIRA